MPVVQDALRAVNPVIIKRAAQSHRTILMILGVLPMSVNVGYPRLNLDDLYGPYTTVTYIYKRFSAINIKEHPGYLWHR